MDTITLSVKNVKCGGCTSNIESNISQIDGVDSVQAFIDNGKVTITGNDLDRNVITKVLNDLGYPEQN